jgi:uncharacterized membrane protein YqaE (UPF0057 family)
MLYLLAILAPPVAAAVYGSRRQLVLNILLTLAGFVPGVVHACLIVHHRRLAASSSWRESSSAPAVEHGWQQDAQRRGRSYGRFHRLRLGMLAALLAVLVAALLYFLLDAPDKTAVVAVTVTNYEWPMTPNSWSREDLDALYDLDGKTITIHDASEGWDAPSLGVEQFERTLQSLKINAAYDKRLVIYLSMHGAVNGAGQPCLLPSGAAPLDSDTWLPVTEILEVIRQQNFADDVRILLVLDCNRRLVNWNEGVLYNDFAERLEQVVRETDLRNLVVLNSTSPGQQGWASPQLQATVFGHFFRLGLAGAADLEFGNNDGQVWLSELVAYLNAHADAWARRFRADSLKPLLLPHDARDFRIAHSLRDSSLELLLDQAKQAEPRSPPISLQEMSDLWKQHDHLAALSPNRAFPLKWRNYEQQLLWLEQCNAAGRAYDLRARSLLVEMERYNAEIENRLTTLEAGDSRSLSIIRDLRFDEGAQIKPHSLAVAELFNKLRPSTAKQLEADLNQFQENPSATTLAAARKAFAAAGDEYSDARFLTLLQDAAVLEQWPDASVVGKALSVRRRGEDLAAGLNRNRADTDLRAQVWAWPLLDDADRTRRRAEDLLLAGQISVGGEPASLLAKASSQYDQAAEKYSAAAVAFATRDQAWARIPYLAQWLARPLPTAQSPAPWDKAVNGQLLPLIQDVNELDAHLASYDPINDADLRGTPPPLADIDQVEKQFGALEDMLSSAAKRLLQDADAGALVLREIDALLALPLIDWKTRGDLRTRREQIASALRDPEKNSEASQNASPAQQPTDASESTTFLTRLESRWQRHPLLAILQIKPASPSSPATTSNLKRIDQQGQQVRLALSSIATRAQDDPAGAERLIRSAAAIWYPPPAVDPILLTGQRDVQRLLIWQARRVLDDFLGPTDDSQQPFFATAAPDYVAMANAMTLPTNTVTQRIDEVQALLAARKDAASQGLSVHASDILLTDPTQSVATSVGVRDGPTGAADGLPDGVVTVFLSDKAQRLGQTLTATLPLRGSANGASKKNAQNAASGGKSSGDSVTLPIVLQGKQLVGRGPTLVVQGLFRGNRYRSSLLLRVPGGSVVEAARPQYGPPAITLRGRKEKLVSVVVVLDCSQSMSEQVGGSRSNADSASTPGAAPNGPSSASPTTPSTAANASSGGAAATRTRLDEAKIAVRGILQQLGAVENVRVGVCLFGHRVGWDTETPNLLRRQTAYAEPIPLSLRPYNDVEMVLPLGRFGEDQSRKLDSMLATVKPWGETPLYLSLIEAIGDFGPSDEDAQKVVLVITDGVNYQFRPPPSADKTIDDILAARGKQDIRIDILGFGIPAEQQSQAAAAFDRLAAETKGKYAQVTKAAEIVGWLKPLFTPDPYRVEYQGQQVAQADMGTLVRLPAETRSRSYTVVSDRIKQSLPVEPGVSLQLVTGPDDDALQASPYLADDPFFVRAMRGPDQPASGYRVAAHRPSVSDGGVRFPVSIQSDDGAVMLRPDETWVEVTPRASDSDRVFDKFVLYDAWYAPNEPVPLLNVQAANWPQDADLAEIRVFGKSPATPAAHTVKLSDVADRPPTVSTGLPITGLPSVTYQVRTRQNATSGGWDVLLVERHSSDTDELASLKVQLSPPPDRARHQFDGENSVVLHTFTYNTATRDEIEQIQIEFTPRQALAAGCWISEKTIERRVPLRQGVSGQ